jgi:hypothetical protein
MRATLFSARREPKRRSRSRATRNKTFVLRHRYPLWVYVTTALLVACTIAAVVVSLTRAADGAQKDRSTFLAVRLRSRVPGTAGNRREQPTASLSVFADIPACSRLFPDFEPIGE